MPKILLPVPYKSQLDNQHNPYGSCNVTSVAMCLEYLKASRRSNAGQFEDELYNYCLDHRLSRHSPYDLAKVIAAYKRKDIFTETATIENVQDWLASGNPAIFHGYFTRFGHIITVVGYDDDGFIVHDPYGEWFDSGYQTEKPGANLHYSYSMIRRLCMPDGNFLVHFVSR